jgi:glycopeptide antibiotics resistance protein
MAKQSGGRLVSADLFNKIDQWLPPRRAQLLTICYVGFIYATLPIMRPILNFLKSTLGEAFSPAVYAFLLFVALGIIYLFLKYGRGWKSLILIAIILGVTAYILPSIKYPEERVHFLEYAVLGIMLYFALREKIKGRKVFIGIAFIVFFIGFGDEIIQGILPNRVYQFSDVVLNFCGGILGELILITFNPVLLKAK